MIQDYKNFQEKNEVKYDDIKQKYHSLCEYVEHLKEVIYDQDKSSQTRFKSSTVSTPGPGGVSAVITLIFSP